MQGAEILIPLTIFGGGFAMIFGIAYLKTRENLAMVEKGMNPKEQVARPAPYKNLKWGLLLTGAGIGLFTAYILHDHVLQVRNDNPAIYFSMHTSRAVTIIMPQESALWRHLWRTLVTP